MLLTEQQTQDMLEAAKPLIKWLNENTHPHTHVQVDHVSVELLEGVSRAHFTDYVTDKKAEPEPLRHHCPVCAGPVTANMDRCPSCGANIAGGER